MKSQHSLQAAIADFISRHNARGSHYFSPVITAVRDFNCALASAMPQHIDNGRAFQIGSPARSPTILHIRDNNDIAVGPLGFDSETLRLFISSCRACLIASREPDLELSSCLASYSALFDANTTLIETMPSHDVVWRQFVRAANAKIHIMEVKQQGRVS